MYWQHIKGYVIAQVILRSIMYLHCIRPYTALHYVMYLHRVITLTMVCIWLSRRVATWPSHAAERISHGYGRKYPKVRPIYPMHEGVVAMAVVMWMMIDHGTAAADDDDSDDHWYW